LRGGPVEVVTAARSALVAITGVEWRGTPEVMAQRLAARGFFALD
jgi:ribose 1,5-bisphosphokinase PhnN